MSASAELGSGYCQTSHCIAEDTLRSHKLLSGEAWDQLRQAEPCPSDCRLIAFLKLVATGFGYRNVSLRLNTTNVFPAPYLECPFELPGQQL